jgi:hypothetical protein
MTDPAALSATTDDVTSELCTRCQVHRLIVANFRGTRVVYTYTTEVDIIGAMACRRLGEHNFPSGVRYVG